MRIGIELVGGVDFGAQWYRFWKIGESHSAAISSAAIPEPIDAVASQLVKPMQEGS